MAGLHSLGSMGGGAGLRFCSAPENPNLEAFKKRPENLSKRYELLAFRAFVVQVPFGSFLVAGLHSFGSVREVASGRLGLSVFICFG